MRRKGKDHDEGTAFEHPAPPTAASRMLTPLDIQQKEFRVSRFGGYRMRDVDEFLDELTEAMTALQREHERLRRAGDRPPAIGAPDLEEVSRQADEIIARARAEAERIVAGAARGASPSGSGGPAGADERAAVEAFLAQERRFLQGLAGLVQEHADTVKSMARDVRRRATAPEASPSQGGTAAAAVMAGADGGVTDDGGEPAEVGEPSGARGEPVAELGERATDEVGEPEPDDAREPATDDAGTGAAADDTLAMPPVDDAPDDAASRPRRIVIDGEAEVDEPVVVDEPEPARSRREEPERRGDDSLRELFWGEDA